MDYKGTLNLPKTDFPMQAKLSKSEPVRLAGWEEAGIYEQILAARKGAPDFILHDGPPYANGEIHIGHAQNKVLKDLIVRFKSMSGYRARYLPGWDCHGLPIEHKVMQAIRNKKERGLSQIEVRRRCREYAMKYVDIQRQGFKRLGIFGEWDTPYLTMNYEYEAAIVEEFRLMAKGGYVYRGVKPVYWCSSCVTALAEAEVEYADHTSLSVFVDFPLASDPAKLGVALPDGATVGVAIWTTTPWTLPGNVAIAVHPDLEYSLVHLAATNRVLIVAKELLDSVAERCGWSDYQVVGQVLGQELEHKLYRHPFLDRESPLVLADYVTTEAGTGCVHTAPGHGQEDFETGLRYNLPVIIPVDDYGRFKADVEFFAGQKVLVANDAVAAKLTELGLLLGSEQISHSYPHCWRCKKPVIFRATAQWFARMDGETGLRKQALQAIDQVEWIPAWGRDRIYTMIEGRPDWCLSRQRSWGVAIPVFYCEQCGQVALDDASMQRVRDLTSEHGSDVWFEYEAAELVAPGLTCACGGRQFKKGEDILDVWFDSGASFAAVSEAELGRTADMYLEGSDQHRGWFHSSLLIAVANRGKAPYKSVLTHGFTVDGKGKKMSKSVGNTIAPQEVIDRYGADVLRLWVISADYREDVRMSPEVLARLSDAYRKIRNSCRFALGNLYDYQPGREIRYSPLDRWVLDRLQKLVERVTAAYDQSEFHVIFHSLHNFSTITLSSQYMDIIKSRYIDKADSPARRAVQETLYQVISTISRLMAPVLVYTADEIWEQLRKCDSRITKSVHLADFPVVDKELLNADVAAEWDYIMALKGEVNLALEAARRDKVIGHSLDAAVEVALPAGQNYDWTVGSQTVLAEVFIASQVVVVGKDLASSGQLVYNSTEIEGLTVGVKKAPGHKCTRCWSYSESVPDTVEDPICQRCAKILAGE